MNERWTPESHVRITNDGMVIEIKLHGVLLTSLAATFEKKVLCVFGEHEEFGKFDSRFEIPANHNPIEAKMTLENGILLRIEVPPGPEKKGIMLGPRPVLMNISGVLPKPKPGKIAAALWGSAPHSMMIYCNGCAKHFDIVVAAKGAQEYRCAHCGKMQIFDLENLINQAIDQSSKMLRKKRGPR
jgi:hypothetical protein